MAQSPCINVCRMDEHSRLCRGCFRTLEEIAGWAKAGEAEQLRILTAVAHRRQECYPRKDELRGDHLPMEGHEH